MNKPTKLLDQVREGIRARHYSIRTEDAYVDWARRFVMFQDNRHPKKLDIADVSTTMIYTHVLNKGVKAV